MAEEDLVNNLLTEVTSAFDKFTLEEASLTPEQKKERQHLIQRHMNLLLHTAKCKSSKCPSVNCGKMKELLNHKTECQIKAKGGCRVCIQIWSYLQLHARQCKQDKCVVPECKAIREKIRQIKLQQ